MTISTPVQALTDDRDALVAIAMNGEPLPAATGSQLASSPPASTASWAPRSGSPAWRPTYAAEQAYWTERDWATDAPILTQSRIDTPRGLNRLDAGRVAIGGVAWAQQRGIAKVEAGGRGPLAGGAPGPGRRHRLLAPVVPPGTPCRVGTS